MWHCCLRKNQLFVLIKLRMYARTHARMPTQMHTLKHTPTPLTHTHTYIVHILFIKSTNEEEDVCTDNIQISGAHFLGKELHEAIVGEELSIAKDVQDHLDIHK